VMRRRGREWDVVSETTAFAVAAWGFAETPDRSGQEPINACRRTERTTWQRPLAISETLAVSTGWMACAWCLNEPGPWSGYRPNHRNASSSGVFALSTIGNSPPIAVYSTDRDVEPDTGVGW